MLDSHVHEWLNLLIRWIHFIVGIAWIGASFYFNWLENNLDRKRPPRDPIAGDLWAVHGGGFYHLNKFATGPEQLPEELHWFKWEAYTTWLTGMMLLILVYYFNARIYMIDPSVRDLSAVEAMLISLGTIAGSWFVYDGICRSALSRRPRILVGVVFLYLVLLAYVLSAVFSGRAAYIHVGAVIGTLMVGNVFFVIIPAQKEMVRALVENRSPDPSIGAKGLLRSLHNNYLTLPVLFAMISVHFPSTYGSSANWLILILISVAGVMARHYFNIRKAIRSAWWFLVAAFCILLGAMWLAYPKSVGHQQQAVSSIEAMAIIASRCSGCHAGNPSFAGLSSPPGGLILETVEHIESHADSIYQNSVLTHTMPPGNLTGITDAERQALAAWYQSHRDSQ